MIPAGGFDIVLVLGGVDGTVNLGGGLYTMCLYAMLPDFMVKLLGRIRSVVTYCVSTATPPVVGSLSNLHQVLFKLSC